MSSPAYLERHSTLKCELERTPTGTVLWVTLNRPAAFNALSGEMLAGKRGDPRLPLCLQPPPSLHYPAATVAAVVAPFGKMPPTSRAPMLSSARAARRVLQPGAPTNHADSAARGPTTCGGAEGRWASLLRRRRHQGAVPAPCPVGGPPSPLPRAACFAGRRRFLLNHALCACASLAPSSLPGRGGGRRGQGLGL